MEETTDKRKRNQGRSPSYPGIDLETAIERAGTIKKEEGRHTAPPDVIISHWEYAPKSGPGLITLAALKKFGLLEDEGTRGNQQLRLTDLAWKILLDDEDSKERLECIQEAALNPTIHRKLWNEYGKELPSPQNLRRRLLFQEKFTEGAVQDFMDQFRRTISFAKLIESDNLSSNEKDKKPPNEEPVMPHALDKRSEIAVPPVVPSISESNGPMQEFNMALSDGKTAYLRIPHILRKSDWNKLDKLLKVLEPDDDQQE